VDATATTAEHDSSTRANDAPPAVKAVALCLAISNRPILHDIHLTVPPGQTVALLGANGAGKSTLLKLLASLTHPSSGSVELFGHPIGPTANQARSRVGLISHQPILYRDLSARENLEFFAELYDVPDPAARATDVLKLVSLLDRADDPVKTLSRGMTQRVSIARALVHGPDLLLADEPFDGLDAASVGALEGLLGQLRSEIKTVIFTNHDIQGSLNLADRAVVLQRGRVAIDQPTEGLDVKTVLKVMAAS
jgi:heme exporter protein A